MEENFLSRFGLSVEKAKEQIMGYVIVRTKMPTPTSCVPLKTNKKLDWEKIKTITEIPYLELRPIPYPEAIQHQYTYLEEKYHLKEKCSVEEFFDRVEEIKDDKVTKR